VKPSRTLGAHLRHRRKVSYRSLNYAKAAAGRAVLLHGSPPLEVFLPLIPALSIAQSSRRLRGHGKSSLPRGNQGPSIRRHRHLLRERYGFPRLFGFLRACLAMRVASDNRTGARPDFGDNMMLPDNCAIPCTRRWFAGCAILARRGASVRDRRRMAKSRSHFRGESYMGDSNKNKNETITIRSFPAR